MSMPSDVTPDVVEARGPMPSQRKARGSVEQRGLFFAALVAFLGVAYLGPTLARATRKPRLADKAAVRLSDARRRMRKSKTKAEKRVRRLGGGFVGNGRR